MRHRSKPEISSIFAHELQELENIEKYTYKKHPYAGLLDKAGAFRHILLPAISGRAERPAGAKAQGRDLNNGAPAAMTERPAERAEWLTAQRRAERTS
jgi:hypothetical protein